jgi:hypothetical protein
LAQGLSPFNCLPFLFKFLHVGPAAWWTGAGALRL